jgi:ATP-dependent helicase/DNAse subunit B
LRCGFQYFLETIVGLDPEDEPMERLTLDPRDKGVVFHAVAERFLRELRDSDALPPKGTEAEKRRLGLLLEEELQRVAASNALRHEALRGREKELLTTLLDEWLAREGRRAGEGQPAHFEVSFGLRASRTSAELQLAEPIGIPLGDGRTLDFAGRIDRIDLTNDGGLVLREYKTGRAPARAGDPDLRAALLVQLPLYVLAARQIFPDAKVVAALCDYVADRGQIRRLDDVDASLLGFERRLRETVVAMNEGLFVQEPSACERCAFTLVCGPAGMVATRQERKAGDVRVKRIARLREGA